MSQKIKSKDLSYDSNLPPFLQRLRGQHVGRGDNDRHEYQIARPKKAKVAEEEDEPTIVDDSGELLSRDQLNQLNNEVAAEGAKTGTAFEQNVSASTSAGSQHLQSITGTTTKKRKVAKVIGDNDDNNTAHEATTTGETKPAKKKEKKSKPIKLAFEQDENG